jgi:hypothetical protein
VSHGRAAVRPYAAPARVDLLDETRRLVVFNRVQSRKRSQQKQYCRC